MVNQSYIEAKKKKIRESISKCEDRSKSLVKVEKECYKIYNKSSKDMSELKNESIDMILTSPPYYSKRNYGNENQIGLENSVEEYLDNLMEVFNECYRVLSKKGSCWVVIGDSYIDGCLRSIPHQFAIEMMKCGWIQRNCIIWHKTNPKPESVKTRLGTSNEFIFFLQRINITIFLMQIRSEYLINKKTPMRLKVLDIMISRVNFKDIPQYSKM